MNEIQEKFREKIGFKKWVSVTTKEQKVLFGFAIIGKKKWIIADEEELIISFVTSFGGDNYKVGYSWEKVKKAIKEKKTLSPKFN